MNPTHTELAMPLPSKLVTNLLTISSLSGAPIAGETGPAPPSSPTCQPPPFHSTGHAEGPLLSPGFSWQEKPIGSPQPSALPAESLEVSDFYVEKPLRISPLTRTHILGSQLTGP